ncbi:MAG: hypothetical protein COU10_03480 [Candidatus Harrisonbacteria bacterium CG10_big_fil_rev_8_21_14_0_10_45_28]|uniref:Phage holin family protein n=1 Tax=Candidatus Harrisonbacteria bacterium CG10_big_fil_rev_8_21_14_0_10_45_28 TaxID=1974586 RepID=A0A2H0UMN2_9BACT|nr:MAG: hypothetical protein COU10_03480 [Candidatus Harrisonbacteria bacterium CG10_big_fil_rev_8_21_14_0_10_45_28]
MIQRSIALLIANSIAFLGAAYLIPNFSLDLNNVPAFIALIAVFSAIQLILRPIIKMVLSPLIIITFGLFNLVITGGILYLVDKYSQNITINGLTALLYTTLIVTIVNIVFNTGSRLFKR